MKSTFFGRMLIVLFIMILAMIGLRIYYEIISSPPSSSLWAFIRYHPALCYFSMGLLCGSVLPVSEQIDKLRGINDPKAGAFTAWFFWLGFFGWPVCLVVGGIAWLQERWA